MSSIRTPNLIMSIDSFFSSGLGGSGQKRKRDSDEEEEEEDRGGKEEVVDDAQEPSDGSAEDEPNDEGADTKPARKKRRGKKPARKNSPRNKDTPDKWPEAVWRKFKANLDANRHRNGTYYSVVPTFPELTTDANAPPQIRSEQCHNPTKSNQMMVNVDGKEYQRPLHRIRLYLRLRQQGVAVPKSEDQASHLCSDAINVSGTGSKHCSNPDHMVIEDDKTNKLRQRCAGWIWIHPYQSHPGGYWYPSCIHSPPCLRYTPKSITPTLVTQAQSQQSASPSNP